MDPQAGSAAPVHDQGFGVKEAQQMRRFFALTDPDLAEETPSADITDGHVLADCGDCTWTAVPPSDRSSSTVRKAEAVSSSTVQLEPCLTDRRVKQQLMSIWKFSINQNLDVAHKSFEFKLVDLLHWF